MRHSHTWRELRHRHHITLAHERLPNGVDAVYGRRGHRAAVILDVGLNEVERSCALAHELVHLLVVTDRRMMFVEEGMVHSGVEDFGCERIGSIQTQTSMSGRTSAFALSQQGDYRASHAQAARWRSRRPRPRSTWRPPAPGPGPAATSPPPDVMERLRKLGELRDAAVVTEEEFESKKAELLSRL